MPSEGFQATQRYKSSIDGRQKGFLRYCTAGDHSAVVPCSLFASLQVSKLITSQNSAYRGYDLLRMHHASQGERKEPKYYMLVRMLCQIKWGAVHSKQTVCVNLCICLVRGYCSLQELFSNASSICAGLSLHHACFWQEPLALWPRLYQVRSSQRCHSYAAASNS
jgi:hypothetical protein